MIQRVIESRPVLNLVDFARFSNPCALKTRRIVGDLPSDWKVFLLLWYDDGKGKVEINWYGENDSENVAITGPRVLGQHGIQRDVAVDHDLFT